MTILRMRNCRIALTAPALFATLMAGCMQPQLPSRSECIVRAEVTAADSRRISDGSTGPFTPIARKAQVPLAGVAFHGTSLYVQYRHDCGQRIAFTSKLLAAADIHLAAPLANETVLPGPKTIALTGPAWRD